MFDNAIDVFLLIAKVIFSMLNCWGRSAVHNYKYITRRDDFTWQSPLPLLANLFFKNKKYSRHVAYGMWQEGCVT